MSKKNKTEKSLRPYEKPTIEQVQLVAGEATLSACTGQVQHGGHNSVGCTPLSIGCYYRGS